VVTALALITTAVAALPRETLPQQPAGIVPAKQEAPPVKIEYHGWFSNPVFSADGKSLVYAQLAALGPDARTAPTHFVVWNLATGKETQRIPGPADDSLLGSLAIAPDGKRVALNLWNTAVRIWDLSKAKETGRVEKSQGAMQLRFAPDGKTIGWLRNGDICLADAGTAQVQRQFGKEENFPVTRFAFANDGNIVIAGHAPSKVVGVGGGKNKTLEYQVSYWAHDTATGNKLHQVGATVTEMRKMLEGPPPHDVFVADGGKTVFLATASGNIQICDAATGKKKKDIPFPWKQEAGDPIRQLAFAGDASVMAVVSMKGIISVWDLTTGKALRRIETGASLEHIALSPNGKTLAVTYQTPGKVGAVMMIYAL
jgi:WD40 repeat protein